MNRLPLWLRLPSSRCGLSILFGLLLCTVPGGHLFAQSGISSALAGTVQDSTGASIAAAAVTATDVNTKAIREGKTDSSGHYLLSQVNPGTYRVMIASPGFSIASSEPTAVGVGAR